MILSITYSLGAEETPMGLPSSPWTGGNSSIFVADGKLFQARRTLDEAKQVFDAIPVPMCTFRIEILQQRYRSDGFKGRDERM